jgi:hypothetical protein
VGRPRLIRPSPQPSTSAYQVASVASEPPLRRARRSEPTSLPVGVRIFSRKYLATLSHIVCRSHENTTLSGAVLFHLLETTIKKRVRLKKKSVCMIFRCYLSE